MSRRALYLALAAVSCGDASGPGDAHFAFPLETWVVLQPFGHYNPDFAGYHLADDVMAAAGTPVMAAADGVVRATYFNNSAVGYGGLVLIEHAADGETFVTLYGHLSTRRGPLVAEGQQVRGGERIGTVADDDEDGGAWGPHLHFGVHKGAFDPGDGFCGVWAYVGYTRTCPGTSAEEQEAVWYSPTDFLLAHGAVRTATGLSVRAAQRQQSRKPGGRGYGS